jgi:hypothetical protein
VRHVTLDCAGLPAVVNMGDCTIGQTYAGAVALRNLSSVPARVRVSVNSKIITLLNDSIALQREFERCGVVDAHDARNSEWIGDAAIRLCAARCQRALSQRDLLCQQIQSGQRRTRVMVCAVLV